MTPQTHLPQPPRVAQLRANPFSSAEEEESIAGDLLEEFSQLVSQSGVMVARRWYRRQVARTIMHLAGSALNSASWSTGAAIVGGFLLMQLGFRYEERAIFSVLHRYQVFDHHFRAFLFFASAGIEIGRVILSLFVGCAVAFAAKGREMVATTILTLLFCAMAIIAWLVLLAWGRPLFLETVPSQFAGWIAIVSGGAIVRTRRSATSTLPAVPAENSGHPK